MVFDEYCIEVAILVLKGKSDNFLNPVTLRNSLIFFRNGWVFQFTG